MKDRKSDAEKLGGEGARGIITAFTLENSSVYNST
jgi:hypothetical protein